MIGSKHISKKKFFEISRSLEQKVLSVMEQHSTLHIGSNLSCLDLLIAFYVFKNEEEKTVLQLGKGQAAAAYWVVREYFVSGSSDPFLEYAEPGKGLSPAMGAYACVEESAPVAALGNSLGLVAGRAKVNPSKDFYLLVGDGEVEQGPFWESLLLVKNQNIQNITVIVDCNSFKAGGSVELSIQKMKKLFIVLGYEVACIDGHDFRSLKSYFTKKSKNARVVLAQTMFANNILNYSGSNDSRYKPYRELC